MKITMSSAPRLFLRIVVPAIIVFIAANAAVAQRTTPVPKGDWGGTGAQMSVSDAGASIDFDCASGSINKQLRMKRGGGFTAEGTFMRSGPGPIRIGDEGRPVIYNGKVTGKVMTVRITDKKTGESVGEYTVTKGQPTRLHRCY
jgi:hypothetical protein